MERQRLRRRGGAGGRQRIALLLVVNASQGGGDRYHRIDIHRDAADRLPGEVILDNGHQYAWMDAEPRRLGVDGGAYRHQVGVLRCE